ncbi:MAG: 4Fe-4S binding protein [Pseudomonadota bacterium]
MRFLFLSRRLRAETFDAEASDPNEYVLAVDTDRCIACGACEMACRIEHRDQDELIGSTRPILVGGDENKEQGRMLCLPHACRQCDEPCEAHDPYNFWSICPSAKAKEATESFCDTCVSRLGEGQWPACATRCTMKTIYFGKPDEIKFLINEKRLNELGDVEFLG